MTDNIRFYIRFLIMLPKLVMQINQLFQLID